MLTPQELSAKLARFTGYLQADPNNIPLLTDLGDLQQQAGRFDDALASFQHAASLAPDSAELQSRIAAVYLAQHRFADAAHAYQRLLAGGAVSAAWQHNCGLALFYQGRYEAAAAQFRSAAAAGLSGPANVRYLANCYHQLGDLEQAVTVAEQWDAAGDDADGQAYLSLLYLDLGAADQARANAEAALADKPDNVDGHTVRGSLALEQLDIETALASFDQVLAQRQDYGRAWLGKGLAHLYQQDVGAALDCLQRAADNMPDHPATLLALGWVQLIAGQPLEAERSFRRAGAVDSEYADAHGGLAALLVLENRLDEARLALAAAERLNPQDFGAGFAKAHMLRMAGQGQQAASLMQGILEQQPAEGGPSLKQYLSTFMARHRAAPRR
ncbi:Tetratricopeptide repeat-containing protein [Duganella sp. CF458]|uniref:tetratricopeptide repeat protein n=1 Tax=Duganella sp. CF458 TaxID=1884368 RepID=UPI0008E92DCD|nr:tetratricopeptide repeat protein [Duganella sp. CF458]SFG88418.1 Tetratricopeptide repeat-containing protein [Duganella sp. CF458]